ncbi:hypothetical protein [Cupriavidus necator]|uniref:hypothetical protein n=1 Tax=Cupriavidus necator TaxID=106590 RepID=UPI0006902B21|nr:hypothetical protein [Cupriavidus necator]
MNDEELAEELERRNAVVVHFSHHANMREGGTFPEDLQAVICDGEEWPLSCSVLFPGHCMEPCGSVGVIFKPKVTNVISVSNTDSGSYVGMDGVDYSLGRPLDEQSFKETFEVKGAYNEWRVRGDAEVMGIFVLDPDNICVKKPIEIWDPMRDAYTQEIAMASIGLADVFAAFPEEQVFSLGPAGLVKVEAP